MISMKCNNWTAYIKVGKIPAQIPLGLRELKGCISSPSGQPLVSDSQFGFKRVPFGIPPPPIHLLLRDLVLNDMCVLGERKTGICKVIEVHWSLFREHVEVIMGPLAAVGACE